MILDVTPMGEYDNDYIHGIFREYSERFPEIMCYSTKQLVSAVDELVNKLVDRGYSAEGIHGDLSRHQRERALEKFK